MLGQAFDSSILEGIFGKVASLALTIGEIMQRLSLVLLIVCSGLLTFAQDQVAIDKCQLVREKATAARQGVTYRETYLSERVTISGTSWQTRGLQEIVPPDRLRTVDETNEASGIRRKETIWIGSTSYERENNGPWVKRLGSGLGTGAGGGVWQGECSLTRNVQPDGVGADQYEVKRRYQTRRFGRPVEISSRRLFLIDSLGRLLKEIWETSYSTDPGVKSRSTYSYEYGVKLQISAPLK